MGLFVNYPYEIRHNLVELFGAITSLTVVYGVRKNISFRKYISIMALKKKRQYLCESGFLPGSVGGLQAPTNWIRSNWTQAWSDVR